VSRQASKQDLLLGFSVDAEQAPGAHWHAALALRGLRKGTFFSADALRPQSKAPPKAGFLSAAVPGPSCPPLAGNGQPGHTSSAAPAWPPPARNASSHPVAAAPAGTPSCPLQLASESAAAHCLQAAALTYQQ
jgi:hypothetical protein